MYSFAGVHVPVRQVVSVAEQAWNPPASAPTAFAVQSAAHFVPSKPKIFS